MNYERANQEALALVGQICFETKGLHYTSVNAPYNGYMLVDVNLIQTHLIELRPFKDGATYAILVTNLDDGDSELFVMFGNDLLGIDLSR